MQKVYFSERPEDAKLVVVKDEAVAYFREDIQEEQIIVDAGPGSPHTEAQWSAEEYTLRMPVTANIQERFTANKEAWRAIAKERDYDETAREIRELRNKLLAESDKEMTIDRIVSSLPDNPGSVTAFLPFLKSLLVSLTGGMAKYRQALRDVPQQEGFPYHVVWPEIEKGDDSDE